MFPCDRSTSIMEIFIPIPELTIEAIMNPLAAQVKVTIIIPLPASSSPANSLKGPNLDCLYMKLTIIKSAIA